MTMRDPEDSVPKLDGRDAAFVMRMLSIARARELPLVDSMTAALDIDGLAHARRFASHIQGMNDDEFLDALESALERSANSPGAEVLRSLRRVGLPVEGLRRLADWYTERTEASHRMFSAISYPFTLSILGVVIYAVIIHSILLPLVLEQFKVLFDGLGAQLPYLTRQVLAFYSWSGGLTSGWPFAAVYVCLVLVVIAVLAWFVLRFPRLRISLFVPLARRYLLQEATASFCQALALTLEHGVPAPEAIELASRVPANRWLGKRLRRMAGKVAAGGDICLCFKVEKALQPSARWRLWSACSRSDLIPELRSVAGQFRDQMAATELRIVGSARILSGVVAAVVISPIIIDIVAMYLPLFSLISQIG